MIDISTTSVGARHRKGLLIAATGGTLFTFDLPLLKLAMADPWTLIFVRGVLLGVAITLFWFALRTNGRRVPFINGWTGLVVAITNTLANIMFLSAVSQTAAANLVFLLALNPIFCALLAWLFLSERIPVWTWVAVASSMVGVAIIVWDGLVVGTYVGDLLAIGVAMCTAVALTVVRKSGKDVITSLAAGSFASAAFALLLGAQPSVLHVEGWGWLALNGLLVIPLASALMALGPRYLPTPEVAMFFLLEVVLTPILIWLIFGEVPTLRALIGGAIVFLTLFAHGFWRYASSKKIAEEELAVSALR